MRFNQAHQVALSSAEYIGTLPNALAPLPAHRIVTGTDLIMVTERVSMLVTDISVKAVDDRSELVVRLRPNGVLRDVSRVREY